MPELGVELDVELGVELGAGAGALDELSAALEGVFASAAGALLSDSASDLGLESVAGELLLGA